MFAAGRHGRSISTPPRCTPPPGCCWPQAGAEEDLLPTSPTAIEPSTCSRTSQPRSSPARDRSRTSAPTRVAECTSWISSADASSPLAPGSRRACYRRAPTSLGIEVQLGLAPKRFQPWKTLGRARAIENQVALGCNCTGRQAGRPYVGASVANDAWGDCPGELDEHPRVLRGDIHVDAVRAPR